jgi:hypothetical protein
MRSIYVHVQAPRDWGGGLTFPRWHECCFHFHSGCDPTEYQGCVCVKERKREREGGREGEREGVREREGMSITCATAEL